MGGKTCLLTLGIADHFKRSPVTIGEAIIKAEDLLQKDESFEKVLKRIGKKLANGRERKYRISVARPLTRWPTHKSFGGQTFSIHLRYEILREAHQN